MESAKTKPYMDYYVEGVLKYQHSAKQRLLSSKEISDAPLFLTALYTEFFKQHPNFFNKEENQSESIESTIAGNSKLNSKWNPKGGQTQKGILWSSLGGAMLEALQYVGADKDTSIFDYGAGLGESALGQALFTGAQVTAVEYEQEFVDRAIEFQDWLKTVGIDASSVTFKQGDFLDSNTSFFDILFYYNSGTYNQCALEQHILDHLRPGGVFVAYHYLPEMAEQGEPFSRLEKEFMIDIKGYSTFFWKS